MATSVHIPPELLAAIDRKAQSLKISRNRLIVRALEREVAPGSDWSPGFFERLSRKEPGLDAAVDELLASIQKARTSKPPQPR